MKIWQSVEPVEESVAPDHGLSVQHNETSVAYNDEHEKIREPSRNGLALRAQRQHVIAQLPQECKGGMEK